MRIEAAVSAIGVLVLGIIPSCMVGDDEGEAVDPIAAGVQTIRPASVGKAMGNITCAKEPKNRMAHVAFVENAKITKTGQKVYVSFEQTNNDGAHYDHFYELHPTKPAIKQGKRTRHFYVVAHGAVRFKDRFGRIHAAYRPLITGAGSRIRWTIRSLLRDRRTTGGAPATIVFYNGGGWAFTLGKAQATGHLLKTRDCSSSPGATVKINSGSAFMLFVPSVSLPPGPPPSI